jgi:hypothetical protein
MMTALLSLASCAAQQERVEDNALEIRTAIIEAQSISVTSAVTANYGDRVYTFSLDYTESADGGEIKILAPQSIAGVTARVTGGGVKLVYDGAELDTGVMADGETTPAGAVPTLIAQWRTGFVTSGVSERYGERDTFAMTTDISDVVSQKTWFDASTKLPIRAEIISGGNLILSVIFEKVTLGGGNT